METEKGEGREKLRVVYKRNRDQKQMVEETYRLLTKDNYFKEHPENVLGTAYETTNQYGGEKIGFKGNMESILQKAQLDLANFKVEEQEVLETIIEPAIQEITQREGAVQNIQKVLRKRIQRKTETPKKVEGDYQLMTFDEIIETYNSEISEEEIKAWIWYKRSKGEFIDDQVIIGSNGGWSKYVIPLSNKGYLNRWLKDGVMAFYEGNFIPSVLYYAENIYNKQEQLLADKEQIINKWGIEQYEKQEKGLVAALPSSLSLTSMDKSQRLIIKPNSDFAEKFTIKELADGTVIENRLPERSVLKNKEGIHSIKTAFSVWLKEVSPSDFNISNSFDIITYYLGKANQPRDMLPASFLVKKQNAKKEGDLLFQQFLDEAIAEEDQQKIETSWNSQFNGYAPINYFRIPVAFNCSSTFKNKPLFIRPAQREGLGFIAVHGSGCIAYDVGVGKTMTGILSIAHAMESGMCKRPLIVVPNQTYGNWLNELRGVLTKKGEVLATGVLPQYPMNDLYNLSTKYVQALVNEDGTINKVEENTITVLTYEGFKRLAFSEATLETIKGDLFKILNQGIESNRDATSLEGKIEELMGKGSVGANLEIESLGFDFLLMDEAHIAKKIFAQVKGEVDEKGERDKSDYKINAGSPSAIALKSFMIANYIQRTNNYSNVVLLTATPFTNSPLEIFSMLSLIGFHRLEKVGLGNLQQFFNHFIQASIELIINTQLNPERKEIIMGFNNLIALQQLIFQFIDHKSGEEAEIQRPNKIVLPLTHKKVEGKVIPLSSKEQISTTLTPSFDQQDLMTKLEEYLVGEIEFEDIFPTDHSYINFAQEISKDSNHNPAVALSKEEQAGTRILRGITLGRQIAFSPYLLTSKNVDISTIRYQDFIDSSPKLQYTMGCIRSVKEECQKMGIAMTGQIIYSNAGVKFFPLIKEYLVNVIGFEPNEVDFFKGGMTPKKKELIKDKFLNGAVKVVLGSQTIREGLNLQNRATDLYVLWLDWNPTDLRQLEGRIWRFGNQFANIRIVIPLVQDSVDIAIFQKLEEKSSRINQLWHRSGKENVMSLEDFNPAELKTSLISNPRRLAKMMILEKGELLKEEITRIKNQIDEIDDIVLKRTTFRKYIGDIEKTVATYQPLKKDQAQRKMNTIFKIYGDYLKDSETVSTSVDETAYKEARRAYHQLERIKERFLNPRGIELDFEREKLISRLEEEIQMKETALEAQTDESAMQVLVDQIIEDRKKRNIKTKTVAERVAEFATLNPMVLGEKMVYAKAEDEEELEAKITRGEKVVQVDDLLAQMKRRLENMKKMRVIAKKMQQLKDEVLGTDKKAA